MNAETEMNTSDGLGGEATYQKYTAVCRYVDNGQPYVEGVEAANPEEALKLTHEECSAANSGEDVELEVIALIRGDVELVDFDNPDH